MTTILSLKAVGVLITRHVTEAGGNALEQDVIDALGRDYGLKPDRVLAAVNSQLRHAGSLVRITDRDGVARLHMPTRNPIGDGSRRQGGGSRSPRDTTATPAVDIPPPVAPMSGGLA